MKLFYYFYGMETKRNHMKTDKLLETNQLRLESLQIMSKFLALGFRKQLAFAAVVMYHYPELDTVEGKKLLHNFWHSRYAAQDLNEKLQKVLDHFKTI